MNEEIKNKAAELTDEEKDNLGKVKHSEKIKKLQDEELDNVVGGVSAHWYGYTYTCDVEAVSYDDFVMLGSSKYRDGSYICPHYSYDGCHTAINCLSCSHYHATKG